MNKSIKKELSEKFLCSQKFSQEIETQQIDFMRTGCGIP